MQQISIRPTDIQGLIELASRAPKSMPEQLWLEDVIARTTPVDVPDPTPTDLPQEDDQEKKEG